MKYYYYNHYTVVILLAVSIKETFKRVVFLKRLRVSATIENQCVPLKLRPISDTDRILRLLTHGANTPFSFYTQLFDLSSSYKHIYL